MNWREDKYRIPFDEECDKELQIEILRDMLSRLPHVLDKSLGSFSFDLLSPASIKMAQLAEDQITTRKMLLMENMTGGELAQKVFELSGITRKPATKASGEVIISGDSGAEIEKGMLVASDRVRFVVMEDKMLPTNGSVSVKVECEDYGSIGNVGSGAIRYFPVTIPGLTKVSNPKAIDNGFDEETDDSLYKRYLEFVRTPATSGNKYHYKQWAKEVDGVGEVAVQGAEEVGAGNVRLVIIDRNQDVASQELLDAVYEHVEKQRPIGVRLSVDTGRPKEIMVRATIKKSGSYQLEDIQSEFELKLNQYRKDVAFAEKYISLAKVSSLLLSIDGVMDIESITLNGQVDNVPLEAEEVPVFPTPEIKL